MTILLSEDQEELVSNDSRASLWLRLPAGHLTTNREKNREHRLLFLFLFFSILLSFCLFGNVLFCRSINFNMQVFNG